MSELKLNIYRDGRDENGNRVVEKTYTSDSFDLLYAPVEDLLGLVDSITTNNNEEMAKALFGLLKQIKPILKDVFWGLSDDELRRTNSKEVVGVTINIIEYAIAGIIESPEIKNLLGSQGQ